MRSPRRRKRQASGFRKFITGLAIVLTGLTAAALILPGYIDWNRFKSVIESQAGKSLGRQVLIAGDIHFTLLPRPELSLEKISLPDAGDADTALLNLEKLDLRIGVLPLLSGKIQIKQFRLIAPRLNLVRDANGRGNWLLPGDMTAGAGKIRFDQISIAEGRMRYRDEASGADFALEQIEAQLSADTLHGPVTANGALRMQGVPLLFDVSLGALDVTPAQNPTPLRIKATLDGEGELAYTGNITAGMNTAGTLRAVGKDLNHLTGALARLSGFFSPPAMPIARILAHPYSMESSLTFDARAVKLDKIRLRLADEALTANLKLERGEAGGFSFLLDAPALNLDALLGEELARASDKAPAQEDAGANLTLPDISRLPQGRARFNLGDLQWKGGHIRNATLGLLLSGNEIRVEKLSAQLPGISSANISGVILGGESQPQFTGKLNLQTANLRGLAGWLGADLQTLPDRSLTNGSLSADFLVTPFQAEFQEINAEIDSSILTGALAFAFRDRPAIGADLQIDALNADNYFHLDANAPEKTAAPSAFDMNFSMLKPWMDCCDYNLKLSLDRAGYLGTPVEDMRLEASLLKGALVINHFSIANIAGSAVGLSGILSKITTEAEGEINFRLVSRNLSVLAQRAPFNLPLPAARLGAAEIDAKLLLADRAADITLDSTFERTFLRMSGKLSGLAPDMLASSSDDTLFVSQVSLGNPSLRKFAAQFGLPLTPSPRADAAGVSLAGVLVRTPQEISLNVLSGDIGGVPVQGRGVLHLEGGKPILTADLAAGEMIAGDYFSSPTEETPPARARDSLPWSGVPLESDDLQTIDADISLQAARFVTGGYDLSNPAMNLSIRDGILKIDGFTGGLFGGTFRAAAKLNAGAPVPEFSAEWKILGGRMEAASAALSGAPILTGKFDFSGEVKGAGGSSFAIVSSLEGSAQLTAADGLIRGLDLPEFSKKLREIKRAGDFPNLAAPFLSQGDTPYRKMEIPLVIAQGVAQPQNPVLDIAAVNSRLALSVDLPRYWLDSEIGLSLLEHEDAPPIIFSYTGPLDQPHFSSRYDQLENHFTQPLLSQSLERIINSRTPPPDTPAGASAEGGLAPPALLTPPSGMQRRGKNPVRKLFDGLRNNIHGGDD